MDSKRKLGLILVCMTAPALALAQEDGGDHGGGGGSGCGDVLGDLVHILRDASTGQPILQKRYVELPGDEYGWDYCPIPVRADGTEIGFADLSCDAAVPDDVVAVDYFGRLSGGRTKERNGRMHFDEVISNLKDGAVGWVGTDETGRIQMGYDCASIGSRDGCAEFAIIDSPMESMALYQRLMKYGHLQTHPEEVDAWQHGDPAAGIQYHPALEESDYAKFDETVRHLLPNEGGDQASDCFGSGSFNELCAAGESLSQDDFVRAASFLSGAASKGGKITVDLVQYMNRILKITLETELSKPAVDTLPALIRDCGGEVVPEGESYTVTYGECTLRDASPAAGEPEERFVDYGTANYVRSTWRNETADLLQDEYTKDKDKDKWEVIRDFPLLTWLEFVQPLVDDTPIVNINGFVQAASDGLRSIEFVHNYAIPDDLWTLYATEQP